jgi:hypothetical protein
MPIAGQWSPGVRNIAYAIYHLSAHVRGRRLALIRRLVLSCSKLKIFNVRIFEFYFNFFSLFSALPWQKRVNFKHCARCGCRHAPPTGKKKCKRLLDANFDSLDVMPLVLEEPALTPQIAPPVRSTDDRIDTLIGVVSDLVSRVDSTQLTLSTPLPADDMAHFRAQGAIPRYESAT